MKRKSLVYIATAAILAFTACQEDNYADQQQNNYGTENTGAIKVHLNVGTADENIKTRAVNWKDTNGEDLEMMNVWTVVAVDNSTDKIVKILCCKPSSPDPQQEIDSLVELPSNGTYRFYSFANIHPKIVLDLLTTEPTGGAKESGITRAAAYGYNTDKTADKWTKVKYDETLSAVDKEFLDTLTIDRIDTIYFKDEYKGLTVNADSTNRVITVNGNNFDPTPTAESNGYGSKGIPMSNVQTLKVSDDSNVDLIVVRLLAKMEIRLYNDSGKDITVDSVTITDVTANATNNLKLLPSMKTEAGHNTMEYIHRNINTNLNGKPATEDLRLYTGGITVPKDSTYASKGYKSFIFYVNESNTPDSTEKNQFKRFFLKLRINGKDEVRYTLIDKEEYAGEEGKKDWDHISRNDYRIIPVVLDNYKLDIIPYDFPAIGVLPASVKEEDGLYTINFHDYGHIHLYPKVTKYSTTGTEQAQIPYKATAGGTDTYWTFVAAFDFSSSWTSWTDGTKATTATDDGSFYVKQTTAATQDADDNGGWPALDDNQTTHWTEAMIGDTYQPFIFAKIAEPEWNTETGLLDNDKTIYHEIQVQLYKNGAAAQVLKSRILMILDKDQMSVYSKRNKMIWQH